MELFDNTRDGFDYFIMVISNGDNEFVLLYLDVFDVIEIRDADSDEELYRFDTNCNIHKLFNFAARREEQIRNLVISGRFRELEELFSVTKFNINSQVDLFLTL